MYLKREFHRKKWESAISRQLLKTISVSEKYIHEKRLQ